MKTKIYKSTDGKRLAVVTPDGDLHLNNSYAGRYDTVNLARQAARRFTRKPRKCSIKYGHVPAL